MFERRRRESIGNNRDNHHHHHGFNPQNQESTAQQQLQPGPFYESGRTTLPMTLEALAAELNSLKSVHGVWMKQKDEELHELRRKVESQEQELKQKTAELRSVTTFGGRVQQQETRRLNNSGNSSNMDDERKRWWPPTFDCVVLVVVLLFTILQFTLPPSQPPPSQILQSTTTSSSSLTTPIVLKSSTIPPKKVIKIKPSESRPPKPIELFDTKEECILMRHKCLAAIRLRHDEFYKSIFPKSGRILLVDPAYHGNVGDHMLTLGEHQFIKRMGLKPPVECDYIQSGGFVQRCSDLLWMSLPKDVTVAIWHAGGNWGDIWRTAQEARVISFKNLLQRNLTVISMPQSLYYKSSYLELRDAEKIRQGVFEGIGASTNTPTNDNPVVKKNVAFTWREHDSIERAEKLYPFVNNVLVPDIAFQLGPYNPMPPKNRNQRVDLLIFLRKDHESSIGKLQSPTHIDQILHKLGKPSLTYKVVDWQDRLSIFKSEDIFFTDTSIQLLSLGRVVICDRLHAAILAFLSGLPFVFIDQKTFKITKTLRVAFESSEDCRDGDKARWAKAVSLEQGIEKAIDFLDRYKLKKQSSSWSFAKMGGNTS